MRPCTRKIKKRKCGIKLKVDNRILTGAPGPIGHGFIIPFRYYGGTSDDFIGYGSQPYQTIIEPLIMIYNRGILKKFTAKAAWVGAGGGYSGYIQLVVIRDGLEEVILHIPYAFAPNVGNNAMVELGEHDVNFEVKNNDQIGVRTSTSIRSSIYATLEYFNYNT